VSGSRWPRPEERIEAAAPGPPPAPSARRSTPRPRGTRAGSSVAAPRRGEQEPELSTAHEGEERPEPHRAAILAEDRRKPRTARWTVGRRVYRDEAERGNNRIVMSAAVPACAAVGRCTVGPLRPSVGWSGPQDMGVSVAKQMAGLLASIRTLPVLLTQPNGSAATVPAQSTRLASRSFRANVGPPLFARVCSHPDCRQCRPRAAPPTAVTVQLLTPSEGVRVPSGACRTDRESLFRVEASRRCG